jgi:hypothetical protein
VRAGDLSWSLEESKNPQIPLSATGMLTLPPDPSAHAATKAPAGAAIMPVSLVETSQRRK